MCIRIINCDFCNERAKIFGHVVAVVVVIVGVVAFLFCCCCCC